MTKIVLYIVVIPLVVYCLDSVDINKLFKKGKSNYYQARIFYMFLVMMISCLVVNFVNDFLGVF